MKGVWLQYTAEELEWIEACRELPRREMHRLFQILFDRPEVGVEALKQLCLRRGWKTGRTGCYPKGSIPLNKGRKMPYNAASAATQFKKGVRQGVAVRLYKPIGTERLSKEGYRERKIHDGLPLQSRWRAVHLINWEAIHGPLPAATCLKCLDGDKTNLDPGNWDPIPRAILPRLNGRHGIAYDTAPGELKPTLLNAAKLAHASKNARRKIGKLTSQESWHERRKEQRR